MESEILATPAATIPAEAGAVEAAPTASPVRREKSVGQLGYKQLRDLVRSLEARVSELSGRNEALESRHAEDRDRMEELSSKLAAYDHAEEKLRHAAEAQLQRAVDAFNARAAAMRKQYPDFDATIESLESRPELRLELRKAIVEMPSGPTVLYFLVKSPDFCKQLQGLPLGEALEQIFVAVHQKLSSENISEINAKIARSVNVH